MRVEEKAYWHALWPLSPPPPDHKEVKLIGSVALSAPEGWLWHVFLLGRERTIDVIGASFPAEVMRSGEPFQRYAGDALNRVFAAASMVYSSDVKLLQIAPGQFLSVGMYSDDALPTAYRLHVEMPGPSPNWDLKSLLLIVGEGTIGTEVLAALSEATNDWIPLHYRFLSLCRTLELLVPAARQRSEWLENYEGDFRALDVDPKRFRNFIPELRNRCAHGAAGDKRAIFGRIERSVTVVTHGVPVSAFDLLMRAVIENLNATAGVQLKPPVLGEPNATPRS